MMRAIVNRTILAALSALAVISCQKDPDQDSNHINNHTGANLTISAKPEARDLGASKYGGMHVVSLGTISGVDENATLELFEQTFSPKDSKSAAAMPRIGCCSLNKVTDDNQAIIGRDMDVFMSKAPMLVFCTDFGKYKTFNVAYYPSLGTFADVMNNNGYDSKIVPFLPYFSTDVFNEKGLYMQCDMRPGENGPDGLNIFATESTNPGKPRVNLASIGQVICSKAATVDEVEVILKDFDFYSSAQSSDEDDESSPNWTFGWMILDSQGNSALLEIAQNKIYFNRGVKAHANYHVSDALAKQSKYGWGVGRTDALYKGADMVATEKDMYNLLSTLKSSTLMLFPYDVKGQTVQYDVRSDFAHDFPVNDKGEIVEEGSIDNCTTAWITAPENKEKVEALIAEECKTYAGQSWEARIESGSFWITGCCDVVNATSREMTIEFFEDEGLTYTWRWPNE